MISPKDKVRANIYKKLLEEEKRRNKKISVFSLSLFVIGVFTGTTYEILFNDVAGSKDIIISNSPRLITKGNTKEKKLTIDDLFQAEEININKSDFNSEKLFVSDLQI